MKKILITASLVIVVMFLTFGTRFVINRTTFGKEKIFETDSYKYYKGFSSIYYRQFEYLIDLYFVGWIPLVNKIDGADPESFVNIKGPSPFGSPYFKDKNAIYYIGKKLDGVDAKSFVVLNYPSSAINIYVKDNNHVYDVTYNGAKIVNVIADPKTFDFIRESNIAKDSRNVYYYEDATSRNDGRSLKIIAGADLASFVSLGHNFYKDNAGIYYMGKRIETADYQTFDNITLAWAGYFKDKNHVYYNVIENGGIVLGADPSTFHQIKFDDSRYTRDTLFEDKNYIYEFGRRVNK